MLLLVRSHPAGEDRASLLAVADRWLAGPDALRGGGTGELFVLGDATDPAGAVAALAHVATVAVDGQDRLGPVAELHWLVVDPDRRDPGHGRRLLDGLCDVLRSRGVQCLVASAGGGGHLALELLQALGFRRTGTAGGDRAAPAPVDGGRPAAAAWYELEL